MDTPTYYAIGPLHSSLTRAAKRLFPSAGSPFPSCPAVSRDPRVFCLGTTADIRTGPFQHNITSIDRHTGCRIWQVVIKTCGNLCFILHIGSRGCQRHGWTLNPNVLTCFKQEVCYVDRDRDTPQNHGSWISRELWRREREMRNPGKSHAHRSWKNLKFQILIHQNMPHWTATIYCDCRWKTVFKTVVTSAEAPGLCRSWRPPRPSPPTAAWRSPRSHCLLQNAAESNLSTAGGRRHHLLRLPAASELPGQYIVSHFKWSTHCPLFTLVHGRQMSKRCINYATCVEPGEMQNHDRRGTCLRWEIQWNPMPNEVERTWNFKF